MTEDEKQELIKIIDERVENPRLKEYPISVLRGDFPTCEYIQLAVKRFALFLEKYKTKEKKVLNVMKFMESLTLTTGHYHGKKLKLMGWQVFLITFIYLFYKEDGSRLIRNVYMEISRKNSKSSTVAALCVYELLRGEYQSEIYCASPSTDQSRITYEAMCNFLNYLDPSGTYIKQLRTLIRFDAKSSSVKVLSGVAKTKDGYNPQMAIIDEVEAMPDDSIYSVMKTGMGFRKEPLIFAIGSGGTNKEHFGYKMREMHIDILNQIKEDDSSLGLIYTLDSVEELDMPEMYIKANPSVGVTVSLDYLIDQRTQAKNNSSLTNYVNSRNFDYWSSTSTTWISDDYVYACMRNFDYETLFHEKQVYIGLDLSSVSDLTAVSVLMVEDGVFHFYNKSYLPRDSMEDNPNRVYFSNYATHGLLTLTDGNVVDTQYVINDLCKMRQSGMYIKRVAYDRFISTALISDLTDKGFKCEPISQSLVSFSAPTKELEKLIKSGRCIIHANPCVRWQFDNVELKEDTNGNVKPVKEKSSGKIDNVVAMIMALAAFMKNHKGMPSFDIIKTSAS